jgi:hypothetical protein
MVAPLLSERSCDFLAYVEFFATEPHFFQLIIPKKNDTFRQKVKNSDEFTEKMYRFLIQLLSNQINQKRAQLLSPNLGIVNIRYTLT